MTMTRKLWEEVYVEYERQAGYSYPQRSDQKDIYEMIVSYEGELRVRKSLD